jgi:DNA-binding MarR family transcriptional regulator
MLIISYADEMSNVPLGFLMSHLADVLRERTTKALTDFGLGPREYGVLWRLEVHGPLSQRELGDLHQIDRTTVVALVDRLESMGLVVRQLDPEDRRRHALVLTDVGRARLSESSVVVERVESEFLATLEPRQRQQLKATLGAILDSGAER